MKTEIIVPNNLKTVNVVKRAMFLAYQACGGSMGLGYLQAVDNATEEEVWQNVVSSGDYPCRSPSSFAKENTGKIYADYVFGRMMKLHISWIANAIIVSLEPGNLSYNSWARKYIDVKEIVNKAIKELTDVNKEIV